MRYYIMLPLGIGIVFYITSVVARLGKVNIDNDLGGYINIFATSLFAFFFPVIPIMFFYTPYIINERIARSYFTKQVLFDGFEVVITRVYENDSEEVVVFNVADVKLTSIGGRNKRPCYLKLKTKNPDRLHVFNVDTSNCSLNVDTSSCLDIDTFLEIKNEIKSRQKQARELTKNSAV